MKIQISRMARSSDAAMQTGDFSLRPPPTPTGSYKFFFFSKENEKSNCSFQSSQLRLGEREFQFQEFSSSPCRARVSAINSQEAQIRSEEKKKIKKNKNCRLREK